MNPTERQQLIEQITAKVVEANPEIQWDQNCECGGIVPRLRIDGPPRIRPIRLADVLLSAQDMLMKLDHDPAKRAATVEAIIDAWNLRKDSISDQSIETLRFLASLLLPSPSQDEQR